MKYLLISVLALISSVASADQDDLALALLRQMSEATEQLNYEMHYFRFSKSAIEPLKYSHSVINKEQYGHLAYLFGPIREVIRRGREVSYIEPGLDPYTIASDQIIAPVPILKRNFSRLKKYYNFVSLGRSREAGLLSQVIRISPKDGERYSYVLWIDEKSKLLLRIDIRDSGGELVEQIRNVKLDVSPSVSTEMSDLQELRLPPAIRQKSDNTVFAHWHVDSLPAGFFPVAQNSYRLMNTDRVVENLMYSDGLFSFSVYLTKADDLSLRDQLIRNGKRTLFTTVKGDMEISVVGDIPPEMASKIANSVKVANARFSLPQNKEKRNN